MPELYHSEAKHKRLLVQYEMCKGCDLCFHVCPVKCIVPDTNFNHRVVYPPVYKPVDGKDCTFCEQCMIVCPDFAIYIVEDKETV
ncbi:MAG: 4Fe-4S dicluster domain-containing protein [Promethearchaeota archaeon]